MSSFELLELFGVEVIEPGGEVKTVRIHGDAPGRVRGMRIFPTDAERVIRVDFPPEDGALAEALRGGERPEWKQAIAQAANELAVLRVVQAPGADADEYGSRLFLPPARQRELADEAEQVRAEQTHLDDGDGMASMWTQREVS